MLSRINTKSAAMLFVALALLTNTVESFIQRVQTEFETVTSLSKLAAEEIMRGVDPFTAAQHSAQRMHADRGQSDIVGVAIALIVVGAVVFVGINIMSQTVSQTALTSGDPLYNASQDFQTTMGDMFGFIGLALLAAFLAVIIYYLTSVRGGGGGFGR